jgi:hypothetical protein
MASEGVLQSVFIMWYILKDDEYMENAKLIGVYLTESDCKRAIDRLKEKPGFCDHDGWFFDEYAINKDHWTEGFVDGNIAAGWFDNDVNSD